MTRNIPILDRGWLFLDPGITCAISCLFLGTQLQKPAELEDYPSPLPWHDFGGIKTNQNSSTVNCQQSGLKIDKRLMKYSRESNLNKMLKIIPKAGEATGRVWCGGECAWQRPAWAVNQRDVISFALHITEERDLLAICGKTFTHSDILVCYVKWKGRLVRKSASTFVFK